ncbi:MAG TPA: DUF6580 family putative transport protein [Candidatus Eisenbacteria bacterium]|nr:DUF6580 family putative transport protein [Candidatus Eisenbacteria bacterium]
MLAYLFLAFAVAVHARFLPLPFSFAPVTAALLYFGARRPRREMWIPVAALAAAGVYLSRSYYGYALSADLLVTWAWYAGMVLLGGTLAHKSSALRVGIASLTGSLSFFVVSNFAVWAVWNMYPKSLGGLMACYVAAVPFFRNAVVSDLFFAAAFFGIGYLVSQRQEDGVTATR